MRLKKRMLFRFFIRMHPEVFRKSVRRYGMKAKPILWIIIPCYNEQEVLPMTGPQFLDKIHELTELRLISENSRILFVDDGSSDNTWSIITELSRQNTAFRGIRQSRNRGHQNAVLAGLMEAKDHCDITISIDCDGQDDMNAMNEMVAAYHDGCEIVYGVRSNRDTDTFLKRSTAELYYKILHVLGSEAVYNHADYRLISNEVLRHLSDYREVNIFLRGMVPLVGFKSTSVYYKRKEREAGKSHYTLSRMTALAADGITSTTVKPIRIISTMGLIVSIFGVISIIWAIIRHVTGNTVDGWASLVCIISLLGGIQLLSLGVIGEYIGKTYLETKQRPRYIISEKTWEPKTRKLLEEEKTNQTESADS